MSFQAVDLGEVEGAVEKSIFNQNFRYQKSNF